MTVVQIKDLINNISKEILGESAITTEDLSNVVDIGTAIFDSSSVDNYVKTLVNRIGKTIFVNRPYSGRVPSVLMDSWEFGSILQKISTDIPEATENESWDLTDGQSYDPNVFYKPKVTQKFFNSKITFEIPLSFTDKQVKESFNNAEELNAFISMLYNSVEKSMTVKLDSLVMRTINSMIAHTLKDNNSLRACNILKLYNDKTGNTLTSSKALIDSEFLRFASYIIALYKDRMSTLSTLYNIEGKARFTDSDHLHTVLLADFAESSRMYVDADTLHKELIKINDYETVPFWQGSGIDYAFDEISKISVKLDNSTTITKTGILGVMFDSDSLGVSNLDRRVTTHYNPKAEFFSNWYKFDSGYFNDLSENFVVFYIED